MKEKLLPSWNVTAANCSGGFSCSTSTASVISRSPNRRDRTAAVKISVLPRSPPVMRSFASPASTICAQSLTCAVRFPSAKTGLKSKYAMRHRTSASASRNGHASKL